MQCPQCGRPFSGDACAECASAAPPSAPRRPRLPLRSFLSGPGDKIQWKPIGLGLLGVLVVLGSIMWFVWASTDAKMKKEGQFDNEVVIPPGKDFGYILIVGPRDFPYTFEVTPYNGRAVMAFGRVDDGNTEKIMAKDLDSVLDSVVDVGVGQLKTQGGMLTRGRYRWVVGNPNDKPLRVKIRFG